MDMNSSRLESLPNEILLVSFKYIDAQNLFRAFYNLNTRLNQLIQSFNELRLVFQMNTSDVKDNIFPLYVYTLVVQPDVDVNLSYFPNIHRLKLDSISKNELSRLNSNHLLHLEHLTLHHAGTSIAVNQDLSLPMLHILKLGCMNALNYTAMLSACPNLRFLDIGITAYYKVLSSIVFHPNLQQMIIRVEDYINISIDDNRMISQIEFLPNEILIDVFEYLNAQDLFRAFYNLNFRFNDLIHSVKNISLTISTNNKNETDNFQLFSSYISTLVIDPAIDVKFDCFTNIRRLNLLYVTDKILAQFENTDILPHLEHLLVIYRLKQTAAPNLHRKVFSNGFPNLISCCLLCLGIIKTAEGWTHSPSLRILKIRTVNLLVYKAILLACPNLYLLRLSMPNGDVESFHMEPHMNLKRMVLKMPYNSYPQTDDVISNLLASTPNLEQFSLYRLIWDSDNIISLVDYDWLATIIDLRLLLLRQFTFYLYFSTFKELKESNMKSVLNQIEEHFRRVHNNRYQSRLIIPQLQNLS